ncbi:MULTISPECIES: HNH endonuclease [unclassified Streptomyces]|uniref:HNH endonuclease n=1 Tax=unclassified Streptomyces TaxID=2593676 RepID=UPI0037F2436A
MTRGEISREAVLDTLAEYDEAGRDTFLAAHDFDRANQFYLQHDEKLYDAKAVLNVAHKHQHGILPEPVISGGRDHANRMLARLGFVIVDGRPKSVEGERAWRLAVWSHLRATNPDLSRVPARALREYGAYGGGQGVWADVARTDAIHDGGIAVGILHTGAHYSDDFTEDGALYRYPQTARPGGRDAAEINAMKAAADLRLPIFTSAKPTPRSEWRIARLAWVEGWDDQSSTFLLSYDETPPEQVLSEDHSDDEPFVLTGNETRRSRRDVTERPGQPRFKLRVFQRYSPRCPLTDITVREMLDAAHLRPVSEDGTNDPRNGIPLNAALHRAYDAYLFAFHPDTLDVVTVPGGPTLDDLRITKAHLRDLPKRPHTDALHWRYEEWLRRSGLAVLPSQQSAEPITTT